MSFFNDLRDLIVNDANIAEEFSPRIYFQLMPTDIDRDVTWLKWGFTRAESIQCLGGGTAWQSYLFFIDVIYKDINDLPAKGDIVIDSLHKSSSNGIKDIKFETDSYSNYTERGLYVRTLNFSANFK